MHRQPRVRYLRAGIGENNAPKGTKHLEADLSPWNIGLGGMHRNLSDVPYGELVDALEE